MIVEFAFLSAPVAQLASQLSLLVIIHFDMLAALLNAEHPRWGPPPYANGHGLLPDFLHPGDKKSPLWQGGDRIGKWPHRRVGNPARASRLGWCPTTKAQ